MSRRSPWGVMFSEYGEVTRAVAEHLLRRGCSTLDQVTSATGLALGDACAALALLLHLRYAVCARVRNRTTYSLDGHERRPLFAVYCDFVDKCAGRAPGLVFRHVLVRGVVDVRSVEDADAFASLRIRGFLRVFSPEEIRNAVFGRRPDGGRVCAAAKDPKAVSEGKSRGAKGGTKRRRMDECESREYACVDYLAVERRILEDCFCCYLEQRYDAPMACLFKAALECPEVLDDSARGKEDRVRPADLDEDRIGDYLEYLVADGVLQRSLSGRLGLSAGWRDILRRDVLCRHLGQDVGGTSRRILRMLVGKGELPEKEITAHVLDGSANVRAAMIGLQKHGCVGTFGNFAPNAFYSRTGLVWHLELGAGARHAEKRLLHHVLGCFFGRKGGCRETCTGPPGDGSFAPPLGYMIVRHAGWE